MTFLWPPHIQIKLTSLVTHSCNLPSQPPLQLSTRWILLSACEDVITGARELMREADKRQEKKRTSVGAALKFINRSGVSASMKPTGVECHHKPLCNLWQVSLSVLAARSKACCTKRLEEDPGKVNPGQFSPTPSCTPTLYLRVKISSNSTSNFGCLNIFKWINNVK